MSAYISAPEDLVLHAPRVMGFASAPHVAVRCGLDAGQRRWVDAPELDSCHTVWIQFHEDLLATLGIPRGSEGLST